MGAKANMKMVKDRDKADTARRWGFVFAIARTWKTVDEKMIKNLVTHLPQKYYQRTRVPGENARKGSKTFWTYHTDLCLRHVGDVTVVLSKKGGLDHRIGHFRPCRIRTEFLKHLTIQTSGLSCLAQQVIWGGRRHDQSQKGRNVGPKNTKILVTNLPELTPRQVVSIYQKRWAIELVNWELKSGLGLGHHQVSGDRQRSTNSMGIAVLAYLFLLRACHHEISPGQSWSIFQLQHAFQLRAMTNQVEHNAKVKMAKCRKAA